MYQSLILFLCLSALSSQNSFGQSSSEIVDAVNAGDNQKARELSEILAQQDDPVALYTLGFLDATLETEESQISSFSNYRAAARVGHIEAMYITALNYANGFGTEHDPEKYTYWLIEASENGHLSATVDYASYLAFGEGSLFPLDREKAELLLKGVYTLGAPEGSILRVYAAYYLGELFWTSDDPLEKEMANRLFNEVLASPYYEGYIGTARSNIGSYYRAVARSNIGSSSGAQRAAPIERSEEAEDDNSCRYWGFTVGTDYYAECRMRLSLAREELEREQRIYEQEARLYEQQVAAVEEAEAKQKQRIFGLNLLAGRSMVESLAAANGISLPEAPEPKSNTKTFILPNGEMITCHGGGSVISCF
jgi:hypothetical protein